MDRSARQGRTRVIAAIAVFLVVVAGVIAATAVVGPPAADSWYNAAAAGAWPVAITLAAIAATLVYALIEKAQTGAVASLARQLTTRTLVLIPLAIAFNVVLGATIGQSLRIPLYLDMVGTVFVAVLAGPFAGAVTGILTLLSWSYLFPPPFQSPTAAAFSATAMVVGLLAGSFSVAGVFRPRPRSSGIGLAVPALLSIGLLGLMALGSPFVTWATSGDSIAPASDDRILLVFGWIGLLLVVAAGVGLLGFLILRRDVSVAYVVLAGIATGIVAAVMSAPIVATVFGGVTGGGTDLVVAALRQGGAGLQEAVLGQSLVSDTVDKAVTFLVVYLALAAMSARMKARFPRGDDLIEDSARLDPAGVSLGAWR
ncbi:MAG: hypothetical protein ACKOTZ_00240 [Chloroflexota bacterium]